MERPLSVAVAGGGKMAREHARAVEESGVPADIVAFADPDPEARSALGEIAPEAAEHYGSLKDLLEHESVDVVHVCAPPATHATLARQALEAGCHVYVEKPFAATAAEARELLRLADARGLNVTAGHQVLFQRSARRARELRLAVGSLIHVESYFSFRPSRGLGDGSPPLRADEQLVDVLPHPVYLLLDAMVDEEGEAVEPEVVDVSRGPGGTLHAQLRVGERTGHLVVTLEGRPVESYLRMVGTKGSVQADFVRDTVQHLLGPGASTVDKILAPFRIAVQLVLGTTRSLVRRLLGRGASYPGLVDATETFHRSVAEGGDPPLSHEHILGTVRVCEALGRAIRAGSGAPGDVRSESGWAGVRNRSPAELIVVTGGTGFLGDAVVSRLRERDIPVRVVSRRLPPPWSRRPGVDYRSADLGDAPDPSVFEDVDIVIHCAAETAGGWDAHRRNSVEATEGVVRAAHAAGARGIVHVSSVAVLEEDDNGPLDEHSPLRADPRSFGPYVWGKLESERRAREVGGELGTPVKVVRPAAIVDFDGYEPPGRLGRRIGNFFLAVGGVGEPLDAVRLELVSEALSRYATSFGDAPELLNVVSPERITRGGAVERMRRADPGVRVLWLPRLLFVPLAKAAVMAQRILRPGARPLDPAAAFTSRAYDSTRLEKFLEGDPGPVPARSGSGSIR